MAAVPPVRAHGGCGDDRLNPRTVIGRLSPTARRLIICRAAGSIGEGALSADFAFYLAALHWTTVQMGAVYMGGLLFGACITLFSGPLSDTFGRKPILIGCGAAQMATALVALLTARPPWLMVVSVIGAYGRGANGAAGPFGPVEQAWLSDGLPEADLGTVYSLNSAVGFGGMALGSVIAALPRLWQRSLPGALGYRPLCVIMLLGALLTLVLLMQMTDTRTPRASGERAASATQRRERGMLLRFIGIKLRC